MKITIKLSNFIWYLAILPFLFPSGFAEYFPAYKNFRVTILGIATVIIIAREIYLLARKRGKVVFSMPLVSILLYHVFLLVITISIQESITQGLQKIFLAPALCILLDEGCRTDLKNIINVICNLLVIILMLNLFVFNQWFFPGFFLVSNHVTFIGHVQVAAEIGILGILVAYIEYTYSFQKNKSVFLAILSLLTMIYSETAGSYLGIIIVIVFFLFGKIKEIKKIVCQHECALFVVLTTLSIITINIQSLPIFTKYGTIITTFSSGRTYIWKQGLNLFRMKPAFGYGAYGVLIKVFWSKSGFNYAHSTLLQLLLDGGITLAVLFFITVILYIRSEDKRLNNRNVKYTSHVLLFAFLSIGVFESLTEYYYLFMFLSVLPYLYQLDDANEKIA